ncbi:MAG: hypothetical protein GHCLOJNM_03504 [bacterium]|nr:hypothetical protein [bacterium]
MAENARGNHRGALHPDHGLNETILFWGCFLALIATAFGFVIRSQIIGDWEVQFNLSETEKGHILGVGLWPFAVSIVLFSLIIDKVGYGKAMVFAFICHITSAIMTITAKNYDMLYWGTFIVALGNGTVEAVINPVVATMFPREKTKWLSILHAGWPGGLVFGGMLAIYLGDISWQYKVALIFLPTIGYGLVMLGRHFPVQERVAAGVSYLDMLKEAGVISALVIVALMVREVGTFFSVPNWGQIAAIVVIIGAYGAYVRSPGRPMFIFLILVMIPLATTELGTDTWITDLMTPVMTEMSLHPGWVLVYTSFIMMVLRFCAGSIVHRISPLGLLAVSATIAAVGLVFLSKAAGIGILAAATIYAFGKTFFWPTMLAVVSEQFPKGGALTINLIAGVGMLGVGIVGSVFLGYIQDSAIDKKLMAHDAALHAKLTSDRTGIFGDYRAVDQEKLAQSTEDEKGVVKTIAGEAKKGALATVAVFPVIMLVCYLILIAYFRSIGGYKAVHLTTVEGE